MTAAKRRRGSSTDDKVEAKRRIIRQSIGEITAEVETELRGANLRSAINIVVPSRHSLVTIGGPPATASEEWSRTSEIVQRVFARWLGGNELRGRPLARSVANTTIDTADLAHK